MTPPRAVNPKAIYPSRTRPRSPQSRGIDRSRGRRGAAGRRQRVRLPRDSGPEEDYHQRRWKLSTPGRPAAIRQPLEIYSRLALADTQQRYDDVIGNFPV